MDSLAFLHAVVIGLVEGLTEFIPVSSTGHIILVEDILGFKGSSGKVFEIVIQLSAILAICWLYRQKLVSVALNLPKDRQAQRFTLNLFLAFLPAMVIGFFAHDFIKRVLFNPTVVSIMLIVGGVAILIIERMLHRPRYDNIDEFPSALAFKIGLYQTLSMIPGTSRSGATIMGAMLLGVERKAATEFSFFLAIPTMLAATVYDLYKNRDAISSDSMALIAVGSVTAFISALIVVRWLVAFVSTHGFTPFAYYRIALGSLMLLLLWL